MKFTLISICLALTMVSVAQAQYSIGSLLFPGFRRQNLFRNRVETPQTESLSQQLANALRTLQGSNMMRNTINAFEKSLGSLEVDLQNLKDGNTRLDLSSLTPAEAQEVVRILKSIPDNYQAFVDLLNEIRSGNIRSITDLPAYLMQSPIIKNLAALASAMINVSQYVSPSSILPNSLRPLLEIPPAVVRDVVSNSCALTTLIFRQVVQAALNGFI